MNSSPKKIFYVITGLRVGGAEMIVQKLATRIASASYMPTVVSLRSGGEIADRLRASGIEVIELGSGKNPLAKLYRLYVLLRKRHPDIVHTHLFHADIIGRIAARLAGVPIVISSIHNVTVGGMEAVREFLLRATKNLVTAFVPVSRMVEHVMAEKGIIRPADSTVIYNGVEVTSSVEGGDATRRMLGIREDSFCIVAVGRLIEQKGFSYVIDAMAHITARYPQAELYILGEGILRTSLERQITQRGLERVVHLMGVVTTVDQYLSVADLFVMPSLWEGFSVALVEAAIAKTLIVTTPVGGNEELITSGENGIIVPAKDTLALIGAIEHSILMSGDERARMTSAARTVATERFSVDHMLADHRTLYTRLCS